MAETMHTDPMDFSFSTQPSNYQHVELKISDDEAVLLLNINKDKSFRRDVELKLNSYDLSVDIEIADALNRLRFEHPLVKVVTITSGHPQVFSSGANIYMLKKSSHAFKVNFCKYTNETRLYIEEASRFSNKKFLCALNGTAAGGGYELALACDRIVLIDDKNANVSLPEVPLLGVLPGTGGLTRLSDKRKIRRDMADVFCTISEGFKGTKAKDLRFVDEIIPKSQWSEGIKREAMQLKNGPLCETPGIKLKAIEPTKKSSGFSYEFVDVEHKDRVARILLKGPKEKEPTDIPAMLERGSDLWILRAFRELDDALLRLRFFYRNCGLWEFHTEGEHSHILDAERPLYDGKSTNAHWFIRELLLHIGRVYKRLDTSARSTVSVITENSSFQGVFAELLFATDRSYGLVDKQEKTKITLSPMNKGLLPTWNETSRLELRFFGDTEKLTAAHKICNGTSLTLQEAQNLELLTYALDDIDFDDELRIFKEERSSLSPDALSAMEASLRFAGAETMATKIFGRLSAWQNWVFIRDNATGPEGALSSYGEEKRAQFFWERC